MALRNIFAASLVSRLATLVCPAAFVVALFGACQTESPDSGVGGAGGAGGSGGFGGADDYCAELADVCAGCKDAGPKADCQLAVKDAAGDQVKCSQAYESYVDLCP